MRVSNHDPSNSPALPAEPPAWAPGRFDFDGWSRLADADPAAYFAARRRAIDALIEASPEHGASLRRLQARIDDMRACAGAPLGAVRQLSSQMAGQLHLLARQIELLERETASLRATPTARTASDH